MPDFQDVYTLWTLNSKIELVWELVIFFLSWMNHLRRKTDDINFGEKTWDLKMRMTFGNTNFFSLKLHRQDLAFSLLLNNQR